MSGSADQEDLGDAAGPDTRHQPQAQRGGRLRRQGRVGAEQDQAQPLVVRGPAASAMTVAPPPEVGLDGEHRKPASGTASHEPVEDAGCAATSSHAAGLRDAVGGQVRAAASRRRPAVLGQVQAPVLRDQQGEKSVPLFAQELSVGST